MPGRVHGRSVGHVPYEIARGSGGDDTTGGAQRCAPALELFVGRAKALVVAAELDISRRIESASVKKHRVAFNLRHLRAPLELSGRADFGDHKRLRSLADVRTVDRERAAVRGHEDAVHFVGAVPVQLGQSRDPAHRPARVEPREPRNEVVPAPSLVERDERTAVRGQLDGREHPSIRLPCERQREAIGHDAAVCVVDRSARQKKLSRSAVARRVVVARARRSARDGRRERRGFVARRGSRLRGRGAQLCMHLCDRLRARLLGRARDHHGEHLRWRRWLRDELWGHRRCARPVRRRAWRVVRGGGDRGVLRGGRRSGRAAGRCGRGVVDHDRAMNRAGRRQQRSARDEHRRGSAPQASVILQRHGCMVERLYRRASLHASVREHTACRLARRASSDASRGAQRRSERRSNDARIVDGARARDGDERDAPFTPSETRGSRRRVAFGYASGLPGETRGDRA